VSGLAAKHLGDGEEILAEVRKFFGKVVMAVVLYAILIGVLLAIAIILPANTPRFVGLILLIPALIGMFYLFTRYIQWRSYSFTVTNRRIVESSGLLKRTVHEVPINKIQSVNLNQGIFERLFKVGDIELSSGAYRDGTLVYTSLPHSETIFHLISQLIDENR
jgi:uncharacterized membrane protein YdbT with pleckstrin-like domain